MHSARLQSPRNVTAMSSPCSAFVWRVLVTCGYITHVGLRNFQLRFSVRCYDHPPSLCCLSWAPLTFDTHCKISSQRQFSLIPCLNLNTQQSLMIDFDSACLSAGYWVNLTCIISRARWPAGQIGWWTYRYDYCVIFSQALARERLRPLLTRFSPSSRALGLSCLYTRFEAKNLISSFIFLALTATRILLLQSALALDVCLLDLLALCCHGLLLILWVYSFCFGT